MILVRLHGLETARKASESVAYLSETNINKPPSVDLTPAMQSVASLQAGMNAPDFTAPITTGKTIHLRDYRGKKVVLYFYPKDDTPGCTVEGCGLRDQYGKIREMGAEVLGVSVDSVDSHKKFTDKYHLPFPLVADTDHKITKTYGVLNDKSNMARRVTFLIDEQGKILRIFLTVKPDQHPQEVLDALKGKL